VRGRAVTVWTITKRQGAKSETAEKKTFEECSRLHKEGPNKKYQNVGKN
jgi:hypothetical protein